MPVREQGHVCFFQYLHSCFFYYHFSNTYKWKSTTCHLKDNTNITICPYSLNIQIYTEMPQNEPIPSIHFHHISNEFLAFTCFIYWSIKRWECNNNWLAVWRLFVVIRTNCWSLDGSNSFSIFAWLFQF